MATQTLKEYLVGLGFQVNDAQLANFNRGVLKAGVGVTALGNIIADGVQQITAGLIQMFSVNRYAEMLDGLNDVSNRTKVAVDEILRLSFLAEQSGSSVDALTSSLDGLTKTAGLAAIGMGRGKKVFDELGISVTDGNGKLKDTSAIMDEIRGKISGMAGGQQQAILSRLGIDPTLVKLMTEDMSEAIAEYNHMLKQSGLDANQAAQDADDYKDSLAKLSTATGLLGKAYAARLFKPMMDATDRLRKLIVDNMPRILNLIEKATLFVLRLGEVFGTVFARVFNILSGVVEWLDDIDDSMGGWLSKIALLIVAWRAFNLSFLATPLGMILSLAAAIALLAEDFYVWRKGGESLIDWSAWENEIQLVIDIFVGLKDAVSEVFIFIYETIDAAISIVQDIFTALFASIDGLASLLTGDFAGAWRAVGESVNAVISIFKTAFEWVGKLVDGVGSFLGLGGNVTGRIGNALSTAVANTTGAGAGFVPGMDPVAQAALSAGTQNVNQKTEIIVQGAADPAATGKAVAGQQDRVNADMTRNMAPRAR